MRDEARNEIERRIVFMKLYLSSYHLGNHSDTLASMVSNKKAALISNALDWSTDKDRLKISTQREIGDLMSIGLDPEELDLKKYFGKSSELKSKLGEYGLVWVRGGNCFVLRRAMYESGFDEILKDYIDNNHFVYGGYSAGVCVVTPTLKGIELVDDANILPKGYKNQTIWDGIGLVNYSIAPHYRSDHPESESINNVVEYFIENKMLFKALRDGEVIIVS
jgi:dipeptidase E